MPLQFEHENPIITDQPISSNAEGLEAIAKTLGGISHEAMTQAASIAEQQSNAMYSTSQAHLDTLKTNAKIQMIQNPGQATKIAEDSAKNYDQIVNESIVNKSDRAKLRASATSDYNDISLDAARTTQGVMKRGAAVSFFTQFPQILKGIKESIGNEKEFENRLQSANELIGTMMRHEAISVTQGESAFKALHHTIEASRAYLQAAGNRELTAKDYHNMKGGLVPVDDGTHMNQPVDENTKHLYQAHNNDITLETLKSDIAKGGAGNPVAWSELGEKELSQVTNIAQGSTSVDADINAGTPFTVLQSELKKYEATGVLSSYETGRKNRIKNILFNTDENAFSMTLSGNPLYRDAEFTYNQTVAAIHENPNLSPDQQQNLIRNYDNDLTSKKVALAESMHMPDHMLQPLSPSFVAPSKESWGLDADPSKLLVRVDYVQQGSKEYLARAQKTPEQQEVTRIVGNIKDGTIQGGIFSGNSKVTESDRRDIVIANQTNRDFGNLKLGVRGTSDDAIRNQISRRMNQSMNFLASQPGGQSRGVAAIDATTNLVKYYAQKAGDLEMKNLDNYIKRATSIVNAAYPVKTGTNWRISQNDIPLDKPDMDKVSQYLIGEASTYLRDSIGVERANAAISQNPLSVVSTPTGHLRVIDSYGGEVYKTRYRGSLLHYADHVMNEREEKTREQIVASIPSNRNPPNEEKPKGMIAQGNIDLNNRPAVKNADGTHSTVKTITIEEDGKTILLPTIIGGKSFSNKEAIKHYKETGEHMGVFKSETDANLYDEKLHHEKGWEGKGNKWENDRSSPNSPPSVYFPMKEKSYPAAHLKHEGDIDEEFDREMAEVERRGPIGNRNLKKKIQNAKNRVAYGKQVRDKK